jgi:hypothetical protein
MKTINLQILHFIREKPGTLRRSLLEIFNLTEYRLNRVLRNLQREFPDLVFPWSNDHGVWALELDRSRCLGVNWLGQSSGGYSQCQGEPGYADGRCYEHSECESPEMIAFMRRVAYLLGPIEPNPMNLMSLGIVQVEELFETLRRITPLTKSEFHSRYRLVKIFGSAYATLKWKKRRRPKFSDFRLPPEFEARHRSSSINPFEYSLKKLFSMLDIPTTSSREQTLRAWKRLARLHHPDAQGGKGNEDRMKELNMAKDRIFRIRRWD